MFDTQKTIPVLDPVHDGRHALSESIFARESIPYVIVLEKEGIVACPYSWVDRHGVAGGICYLFGPGIGDKPIVETFDNVQIQPDGNFDDWQVGGIRFQQDMDLMNARFSLSGARASFDCRFEGLHPAYAYGFHPRGCPPFVADNRIEQTGRVTGSMTIDGRTISVDTIGWRDHSWGTRDWEAAQHWKWLHAQAGADLAVHFFDIYALGRRELRGYVLRDGLYMPVVEVQTHFTVDADYKQKTIFSIVHDADGGRTEIQGDFFGHYPLIPGDHTTLIEGGMTCTINGRPGGGYVEFLWPARYLSHIRSHPF